MSITVILLYAIFRLLNIEVITLLAFQNAEKRDAIMNLFNDTIDRPIMFLMTYAIKATGLNLQKNYHRVHLIKETTNFETLSQALKRYRRLGNPSLVVYVYEYYVDGTFDNKNVWRNIDKTISKVMIELNRAIFSKDESEVLEEINVNIRD